jgi:hypothetical protein
MHCGRNAGLCQSAQWGLLLAPRLWWWCGRMVCFQKMLAGRIFLTGPHENAKS